MKKILNFVDRSVEIIIALLFVVMIIAGSVQVFNRFLFNQSVGWSYELQKFAHIWLIFLAIPLVYKHDSHIGIKVLSKKFSSKWQKGLRIGFDILWLILAIVITYYTISLILQTKFQISPGLNIRMDIPYIGMITGGIYLMII
jgi:TRAP-type C4-dicarboxylate transport system permease small subunit